MIIGIWAQCLLLSLVMAVVMILWVSISVVFCLALVRAAARRQGNPGMDELPDSPKPKAVCAPPAAANPAVAGLA
jgi:hypothetical protein